MSERSWNHRYLRAAQIVASWSKDPSTKCGAIIVRDDKTIASVGFNGFPRGTHDHDHLYADRAYKYPNIIHSEWNALMSSQDDSLKGYSVYAWPMPPCHECTTYLAQKKIDHVVCQKPTVDKLERWQTSFDFARTSLSERNISYTEVVLDDVFVVDGSKLSWDGRFLDLAKEVCSWSKDPISPRGAVIVRDNKTICSLGFNGFPQGVDDTPLMEGNQQAIDYLLVKAEINAMLFSRDPDFKGHVVYCWPNRPSLRTVMHLIQEGLIHIVCPATQTDEEHLHIQDRLNQVGGTLKEI